jgi:hypothetical protein
MSAATSVATIIVDAGRHEVMRPAALFESSLLLQAVARACQRPGLVSAKAVLTASPFLAAISHQLSSLLRTSPIFQLLPEDILKGTPSSVMDGAPHDNRQLQTWLVLAWQVCELIATWPDQNQTEVLLDHETLRSFVMGAVGGVMTAESNEVRAVAFRCASLLV